MNKKKYLIYVFILVIIKQILLSHIPIFAIGYAGCDDQLMIKLSAYLLHGDYLGTFDCLTLVKGLSFPLFLAFNTALGISYLDAITLLYSLSCIYFVHCVDKLLNKKWMKYILITVLLFNPIMYTLDVVQRVYRNSLIPSQVLLIFGSFFYLYINRNIKNKNYLIHSIICALSLLFFYNTREDSIWIMPFVIICTLITIITLENKNIKKILILLLPIFVLVLGNNCIKLINYKYYGTFTRIDEENSEFSTAMKTLYKVKPEKKQEYVSITREKMNRLYEISPTLKTIQKELDKRMNEYSIIDRSYDEEVEDGWFWWTLRFAAQDAGYYESATKANSFYKNVTKEINDAIKDGKLETVNTMPSSLMSPWKKGYGIKLINAIKDEIIFTNSFKDLVPSVNESTGELKSISYFEIITNNKAIYPTTETNVEENNAAKKVSNVYIIKLKLISYIYRTMPIFSIISIISYIILTYRSLKNKVLDNWLIITSILLSYVVLLIGVGYNHISSCNSITALYLCASYPLIIIFNILAIFEFINTNKKI